MVRIFFTARDLLLKASTAEQMDVHEGTATVREAMRFSAYLRQPFEVSKEEKDAYVEEMIELLELQDLADAMVFSLGVEGVRILSSYNEYSTDISKLASG